MFGGGGGGGRGGGGFGGGGRGGGGGGDRQFTPRGQMSAGANNKPPLSDLNPQMRMMFQPRPPLEFKKPVGVGFDKKECPPYTGIGEYVSNFERTPAPPRDHFELPADRKKRIREHMQRLQVEKNDLLVADWDPHGSKNATENAYHTLFVARLSYDTTDKKLRREFEQFGNIKTVKIVMDKTGAADKPRGYAFVEFEREEDMTAAYKRSDGKKIDGRRILVDVERGRTVRNWRPRRLGGGLGGRKAKKSKKEMEADKLKATLDAAALRAATVYGPAVVPERRAGGGERERSRDRGRVGDRDRGGSDRDRAGTDRERGGGTDRDRGGGGGGGGDSRYGPGGGADRGGDRGRRVGSSRDRDRDRGGGGDRERRRSRSRDRR